jgi:hypothetical protein
MSRCYYFVEEDFLRGTLAPARRACESPMAIACLRLFTFFPERPLFNVPLFRSCNAFSTFSADFLPYRATLLLLNWKESKDIGPGGPYQLIRTPQV